MTIGTEFEKNPNVFACDFKEVTTVHGATYVPSVSEDGVLSWHNDQNLPNPAPVSIKGKDGVLDDRVTPQMFGAVGDGVHDDTDAIREARARAIEEKKVLYFPAGTYLIHGSIELWSDCEIYGDGSKTVIKKIPAYTEVLKPIGTAGTFTAGQDTFTVADGSKYTVGYDVYMGFNWENVECLCGRITSISGNNVTVATYPKFPSAGDSAPDQGVPAQFATKWTLNYSKVEVVFSTSFPVFCSNRRKEDGSWNTLRNVHIHDLTIDGNRQTNEAKPYSLSAIHFDPLEGVATATSQVASAPNENIRLENLNIYNSPADGISIQSGRNISITNCLTENCGYNGIHVGVGSEIVSIVGCKLNADYCGYFDCVGVNSVSLSNNHFERCPIGVGGLDTRTRGLTVNGNTFRNCDIGIKAGATETTQAHRANMAAEIHTGIPSTGITICDNTFYGADLTGIGVSCTNGHGFTVNSNTFRDLEKAIETGETSHVSISNNIIKDCAAALVMGASDAAMTTNSTFVGNIVQAELDNTSAAIAISYAENMLVTGNVLSGEDAALTLQDTATGVIVENNILSA